MRYLLLSDLHSNLEATRAVLEAARAEGFDAAVVLGDLVGYGARPNEVVEAIRALGPVGVIRGNHDRVVSGLEEGEDFNPVAMQAALMNRRRLSRENLDYLARLPQGPLVVAERFLIAHGTPRDEDEYLSEVGDAGEIFDEADFSLCFFGHTHLAGIFEQTHRRERRFHLPVASLTLDSGSRYLINPGSVGQPRDGDPRAAFALFEPESGSVLLRRVAYGISAEQERMIAEGYPEILVERLSRGI